MKKFLIIILFLLTGISGISAENTGGVPEQQKAPVMMMGGMHTLLSVINEIEKQTDYLFVYSENDVNISKEITLNEGKSTVKECLDKIMSITGLEFFFENNYIILAKQSPELHSILGRIIDRESGKPLVFASVTMTKSGISNVSNGEGFFSLKFPEECSNDSISISYIGYKTLNLSVTDVLTEKSPVKFYMETMPFEIPGAIIRPKEANDIVKMAIANISKNYPMKNMKMTAFYREMIKKRNTYVTLTEAALDINKIAYENTFTSDQATIFKGRGSVDWNKIDTVFVKFRGGISSSLENDIMKNPFLGVDKNKIDEHYTFSFENSTYINDKIHYIISFTPIRPEEEILFEGKLYIDANSLALTRAEMGIKIDEKKAEEAASLFVRKKPKELKTKILYATYLVQYKEYKEKYVFDYSRTELKFDAKWSDKLFKNTYTIISELAITDKEDEGIKIPSSIRVRSNDIVLDRVEDFKDDEFWKDYNVIEPEEGINNVISKIIKNLNRKER
jgi:hypothetical protein